MIINFLQRRDPPILPSLDSSTVLTARNQEAYQTVVAALVVFGTGCRLIWFCGVAKVNEVAPFRRRSA